MESDSKCQSAAAVKCQRAQASVHLAHTQNARPSYQNVERRAARQRTAWRGCKGAEKEGAPG